MTHSWLVLLCHLSLSLSLHTSPPKDQILVTVKQEDSVTRRVTTVEGRLSNFTVCVTEWEGDQLELYWDTNGVYIQPKDQLGNKIVFVKDGVRNVTVNFEANLIGIYDLRFYTLDRDGRKIWKNTESQVEFIVKRKNLNMKNIILTVFTSLLAIALCFMGLEIDINIVISTIKRPVGPCIGLVCQFLLMPLSAYFLGWLFLQNNYERLGLILLGSAPGGANSNFWTAMFNGDVNLSCTMTFLSTLASFAFTSLWVFLLGTPLVDKTISIPYIQMAMSLLSFTVPLLLGVGFKYKWPKQSVTLMKMSRPFFFICLLIFPTMGIWHNTHFFYLCSWRHFTSGVLLGLLGYTLGALFSALARQGKEQIIAISLETAIQNGGIAFIVLSVTFESPYSDMGLLPILSFFMFSTGPIMFVVYAIYLLVQAVRGKKGFKRVPKEEMVKMERRESILLEKGRKYSVE